MIFFCQIFFFKVVKEENKHVREALKDPKLGANSWETFSMFRRGGPHCGFYKVCASPHAKIAKGFIPLLSHIQHDLFMWRRMWWKQFQTLRCRYTAEVRWVQNFKNGLIKHNILIKLTLEHSQMHELRSLHLLIDYEKYRILHWALQRNGTANGKDRKCERQSEFYLFLSRSHFGVLVFSMCLKYGFSCNINTLCVFWEPSLMDVSFLKPFEADERKE